MRAITKLLAGGAAMAALAGTAPAAAQYYPGYGYGNQSPGVVVDRVLNDVMGGGGSYGYGGYSGYGLNSQAVVNMCVNTIQARLGGGYGGYGYGAYGYGGGGGGRVLGISRVEPRSTGGIRVRGVASSGMNAGYGYGYGQRPDLTWKCSVDLRGAIVGLDVQRAYSNYSESYTPWGNYDYSQYGYRRY
jgi:hypothetical protein